MGAVKRLLEDFQEHYETLEDSRANYERKRDKRLGAFDIEESDLDRGDMIVKHVTTHGYKTCVYNRA